MDWIAGSGRQILGLATRDSGLLRLMPYTPRIKQPPPAQFIPGGAFFMPKKEKTPEQDPDEKLKWDTARELGLDDDLAAGGDELSVREAGKIGGNMVRKLVAEGKEKIAAAEKKQVEP